VQGVFKIQQSFSTIMRRVLFTREYLVPCTFFRFIITR